MFTRLIRGQRKIHPRWKDEKGNFVGWSRLLRNFPRAFATGALRITVGKRPHLPWISYDAIHTLENIIKPESKVLEFGSGMSTIWYAKKAREVYSVEDDAQWYDLALRNFESLGIKNVKYEFAKTAEEYASFGLKWRTNFDLIIVDGSVRSECIRNSLALLTEKGALYLDNSDKHSTSEGGDTRAAEELLLEYARENSCDVKYFTDFAPTQFFAQQGMLVKRV
jgi:predicted O-methyltransferase YrrM